MQVDKKKFLRLKKKVLNKYPNATTKITNDGKFYVSDGMGSYIGEEFMIPPQDNVASAWHWAAETIRTSQNIMRTHPDKMEFEQNEKKFMRLSRRNRKN
jgi:hypothetical protein